MPLSREEVEHVASLARLGLTTEELSLMQDQLSSILGHIAVIDQVDTAMISPTAQVGSVSLLLRADVVAASLPRDAVLANAPRQQDGFIEVSAILDVVNEETDS